MEDMIAPAAESNADYATSLDQAVYGDGGLLVPVGTSAPASTPGQKDFVALFKSRKKTLPSQLGKMTHLRI